MKEVVASADDAAGRVDDELALRILFESREEFVQGSDFFAQVLRFAFRISGAVRPAHPGGDAVDTFVATRFKDRSKTGFDLIVATNRGTAERGKILDPMGFARTGHADEREAKGLIGIGPH